MKKLLFVLVILSMVFVTLALDPACPGGNCPPPTEPPPNETEPPESTEPPEVTEPPERHKETEPPEVTEKVRPGSTPEKNPTSISGSKPGNPKDQKVISLPKSGYGPKEDQNKDILGYILIIAVLGLTVIVLGGLIKKNPED